MAAPLIRLIPLARVLGLLLLALVAASCSRKPPYEGKSIDRLRGMLKSAEPATQIQGAYGLSLKGGEASPAVPDLIELLSHKNLAVRQNAIMALGKIGPAARDAVPGLTDVLRSSDWRLRRQAAIALGEIGSEAYSAVTPLLTLRRDSQPVVRQAAEQALSQIDPTTFAPRKD
jgi:HEAT repeat protein